MLNNAGDCDLDVVVDSGFGLHFKMKRKASIQASRTKLMDADNFETVNNAYTCGGLNARRDSVAAKQKAEVS